MRALLPVPTDARHASLRRAIRLAAVRERTDTADFLSLIAQYDALRLYVEDGYASMHAFCVGELLLCEDAAYKRVQAARAARKFPQLLPALVEGRLHLSAIVLLAPHLTAENVDEWVSASTHRSHRFIRDLIARRLVEPQPAMDLVGGMDPVSSGEGDGEGAAAFAGQLDAHPVLGEAVKIMQASVPQRVDPTLRIDVHCTVDRDKLDQARALLSHSIPSGDLGKVLDRALESVIRELEKTKFGLTSRPRSRGARRPSTNPRHVPAEVKREVWKRDEGQCTFIGHNGHRCGERRFLEFDHVRPVALGGESTVDDLRLRCRIHNQYEAERVFGTDFMAEKREAARQARAEARESREATRTQKSTNDDRMRAIASGLRNLGCRADEARHAAESAVGTMPPGTTLEDCLRAALRSLRPPRSTHRVGTQPAVPVADTASQNGYEPGCSAVPDKPSPSSPAP
jgi:hypothetical protein